MHLEASGLSGEVACWDDTKIKPGEDWGKKIERAMKLAKVAVLLISADFLASDFIRKKELPALLRAADKEGVSILPVILKPSPLSRVRSLARIHAVNPPGQPLSGMTENERENFYVRLTEEIEHALES